MRGMYEQTGALFSYLSPDALVPRDHPLRSIRPLVNTALDELSPQFEALYALGGRASIAPEKRLRALLLQAYYGIRSERQLMEQVTYNLLFRWFVGLSMDAPVWDVTVFTKNRERLLAGRRSAIDGRTTRHPGYAVSQRLRKRIEEPFGWIKSDAGLRKTRHRGLGRVGWAVTLTAAAANLVRLPKLLAASA